MAAGGEECAELVMEGWAGGVHELCTVVEQVDQVVRMRLCVGLGVRQASGGPPV